MGLTDELLKKLTQKHRTRLEEQIKLWEKTLEAQMAASFSGVSLSRNQAMEGATQTYMDAIRAQAMAEVQAAQPAFTPQQIIVHQRRSPYNMRTEVIIEIAGPRGPEYVVVPTDEDQYVIQLHSTGQLMLEPPKAVIIFDLPEDHAPAIKPRENVEAERSVDIRSDLQKFYDRIRRR